MLERLDPKATMEFIPSCEVGAEKPTTFYIRPETARAGILFSRLKKIKTRPGENGQPEVDLSEDGKVQDWFDYVTMRIAKIENAPLSSGPGTAESAKDIADVLENIPNARDIFWEVFIFSQQNRNISQAEIKN